MSGGPVLNKEGEVIGINTFFANYTDKTDLKEDYDRSLAGIAPLFEQKENIKNLIDAHQASLSSPQP